MSLDRAERLNHTIEFVRNHLGSSKGASVFNDVEILLYSALGLPDNKVLDFVRTSFPNDASRKKVALEQFGIDLSKVARGKVAPILAAIIFVHGDLEALSKKFQKPQSAKLLAYRNHPLWAELENVILDSNHRVSYDWKDRVRLYLAHSHSSVGPFKKFLTGFLSSSDLKTDKHTTIVQRIIKKIESDNSFGIDRKGS
ncbi:MAG: hypothetical protein JNM27_11280 [Leptospirales bacterium]|nr:hypothetical protein [Leptospirales bacterium]